VSSALELAEARQETRESWSAALQMIREAVETLGPPGMPPSKDAVLKRADAPYRGGRSETWLKIKCVKSLRFPIIGYVPKANSIAALRLARREGKQLVYVGKAGTGFTAKSAIEVRKRLEPLIRKTPPTAKPLTKKDTVWVEPKVEADIEFRDITSDGMLREASFKGLK